MYPYHGHRWKAYCNRPGRTSPKAKDTGTRVCFLALLSLAPWKSGSFAEIITVRIAHEARGLLCILAGVVLWFAVAGDLSAQQPLSIPAFQAPDGYFGVSYSHSLTATGGAAALYVEYRLRVPPTRLDSRRIDDHWHTNRHRGCISLYRPSSRRKRRESDAKDASNYLRPRSTGCR